MCGNQTIGRDTSAMSLVCDRLYRALDHEFARRLPWPGCGRPATAGGAGAGHLRREGGAEWRQEGGVPVWRRVVTEGQPEVQKE